MAGKLPETFEQMAPSPDTARQTAGDALAMLPDDERAFLQEETTLLITGYHDGADMPALFKSRHLDMEETLAIWFLLPSYVRSAIKKRP